MPLNYANTDLEYLKREELKKEDVQHLQKWLAKQYHLPSMHELEIIFFLQSCNYRVELTKTTIDNYYTIRTLCPEMFGKRDPSYMVDMLNNFLIVPLPKLTCDGCQIVLSSLKNCDPEKYVFVDTIKYTDMVLRIWYYERGTADGYIHILDTEGFTFSHLTKIPITFLKKFIIYLQEALPSQLKQIHFINASSAFDKCMKMMKPFMNKKLFDMIFVHNGPISSLHKHIAPEYLPKDYGGTCKSSIELRDDVIKMIMTNMDFVKMQEEKVVDESKRLEKSDRIQSLFGSDGFFKQLDLD